MSEQQKFDFSSFNRQNTLGVIIMFVQSARSALNAFLAFFAYSFFVSEINLYTGTIIGVILVYMAVVSFLRYQNFEFRISEKALILNSGVLTKEVINIPFERIQSVHLSQNFIQRILGINGLKIDTAGSSTQELEIPALSRSKSAAFQEEIELRIGASKKIETLDLTSEMDGQVSETTLESTPLVSLDLKGLTILAITENHVRNGLFAVIFIFGYLQNYLDVTEEYIYDLVEDSNPEILKGSLTGIMIFIILFLLISVSISFVRTFSKFWKFKAEINIKAFIVKSGLFRRNEYTIPRDKIQFLEWKTNFLRKRLGFESIKIYQGSSDENSLLRAVEIPACYASQTNKVMDNLYPQHESEVHFSLTSPNKFQIRYRAILFSVLLLPLTISAAVQTGSYIPCFLGYVGWVFLQVFIARRYVNSINLWVNSDLLIYERGWLFKRRTVLPHFKIQAVDITQSIFHIKREVCHFSFSTAAGERRLRFFNYDEMAELRDYLLYKAESHRGSWM